MLVSSQTIEKKLRAGFIVAVGFLALMGAASWWTSRMSAEAGRMVEHTHRVFHQLQGVRASLLGAEAEMRGYVIAGDEAFLAAYAAGTSSVWRSFADVRRLTVDNPSQQWRLDMLRPLLSQRLVVAEELAALRGAGDAALALERVSTGQGKRMTEEILARLSEISDVEHALLERRSEDMRSLGHAMVALACAGCGIAIALVGLAGLLVQKDFQKRQHAEEERDRFFDLSLDILCISKSDGYFKKVSAAFTRTLGWSREELLARPFVDFVHPDDLPATLAAVDRQVKAGEPILSFDNRYRHRDGSWRVLSWRSVPYPGGFMYATARDVTEFRQMEEALRRSEESLSVTLDSIGDGVLATDTEGRVTRMNPIAARLTGWTSEEACGRPIAEVFRIINEETRLPADIPVENVLKTGLIHGLANHTVILTRGGAESPIADSAAPIRDKAGNILGVVLVFRDVTEEHRAQREVEESRRRLLKLNEELEQRVEKRTAEVKMRERENLRMQRLESLGTLAGGVAHDLNNALAPILMSLEELKEQYPREAELLAMIDTSARRGADMVRQLLTFAKGADGNPVSVSLDSLLQEMQIIIRGAFPKNIHLEVTSDPRLPKVRADPTQLHQVLLNLAANARDAMPTGGTLAFEVKCADLDAGAAGALVDMKPGRYLTVKVRDTGTGIPPDIVDRIFDPFFTTKSSDAGTGLGLSTVMGIVRGHQGCLTVETQPGKGSVFTVYLPVEQGQAELDQPAPSPAVSKGHGETILFVDDEFSVRSLARVVLRRLGYEAVLAADGHEGLLRAAEQGDDLRAVITDVRMPQMDGIAFVRALRKTRPTLPVVVISGRQEEAVRQAFSDLGAREWLEKPFSERQLSDLLRRLFETKPAVGAGARGEA